MEVFYIWIKDPVYNRMKKIEKMIFDNDFRRHILGDGLQDYIQEGNIIIRMKISWTLSADCMNHGQSTKLHGTLSKIRIQAERGISWAELTLRASCLILYPSPRKCPWCVSLVRSMSTNQLRLHSLRFSSPSKQSDRTRNCR